MLPPVPSLGEYGISASLGFLPVQPPLQRLPEPYYDQWEVIITNLQGLLLSKRLSGVVEGLPVLSTEHLLEEPEWRRAYSILGFISHAYIWGGDRPIDVSIAPPLHFFLGTRTWHTCTRTDPC